MIALLVCEGATLARRLASSGGGRPLPHLDGAASDCITLQPDARGALANIPCGPDIATGDDGRPGFFAQARRPARARAGRAEHPRTVMGCSLPKIPDRCAGANERHVPEVRESIQFSPFLRLFDSLKIYYDAFPETFMFSGFAVVRKEKQVLNSTQLSNANSVSSANKFILF